MTQLTGKINEICDREIEAAREYRDRGIQIFRGEKSMENMFRADCRDRVAAARAAKKGDFERAFNIMTGMDTAARDEVTDRFWNVITSLNEL